MIQRRSLRQAPLAFLGVALLVAGIVSVRFNQRPPPSSTSHLYKWLAEPSSAEPAAVIRDSVCERHPEQCAYAALLCDDELVPALEVLLYSLKKSGTSHPLVVLALPGVTAAARDEIGKLADQVRPVDQLAYPFEGLVKFEVGINKQCRYSKLHLWGQTDFDRVVYLDADTAVQKNIDHLFALDVDFAGVRDIGDVYNTGVLLLRPSKDIFKDMLALYPTAPSYNRGDQGFLNWYFTEHRADAVLALPPAYNVPAKYKSFAIGKKLIQDAFVHHFTAETKPWSFHHFYHADWRLNYHAGMFSTWRQMQYNVTHLLGHEYGLPKHEISLYSALADYNWPNEARQRDVCARYEPRWEINGKFPRQDKYSVAISFFSAERLPHLPKLIKHYLLSDLVDTVFLTWHDPQIKVPSDIKSLVSGGRVRILRQNSDSLNNRFNPIRELKTQAIFIADDDIYTPISSVDFAFEVWRARPESIVGFFPRIHGRKEDGSVYYEMAGVYHKYDIILTKGMMINSNYLHAYTCVLAPEIHRYVDMGMNCEDIAMNMMVSGLTNAAPVCVAEASVLDFGTSHGISISSAFTVRRDQCTQDLIELFERDTLLPSREMVHQFNKNKFAKMDWDRFDSIMDKELQGPRGGTL